jgi:hypothetical protein
LARARAQAEQKPLGNIEITEYSSRKLENLKYGDGQHDVIDENIQTI